MQNIGDKIYELRKERGLSQEELADVLGVSRQSISKWELNVSQPSTDNIKTLCGVFKVNIDYFLEDETAAATDEKTPPAVTVQTTDTASAEKERKQIKYIYLSASIILTVLGVLACLFSFIVGMTAFTPNKGVETISVYKFDAWAFGICVCMAVLLIIAATIFWVKFALARKNAEK